MSSEEDEDDSIGEVFGQRHPPLSIYIKGILERYPDGQIFKVRGSQSYLLFTGCCNYDT
jgi:hypothetical protein